MLERAQLASIRFAILIEQRSITAVLRCGDNLSVSLDYFGRALETMTLTQTDRRVILAAVARLQAELGDDLLGVLVGGSRVRGEARPNSDLDVVALVQPPRHARRNVVIDNVEVEVLLRPAEAIRRQFHEERVKGRVETARLLGTGVIVFDPTGLLATLVIEARALQEAGPPPLSLREHWRCRYAVAGELRDIADVIVEDEAQAGLLLSAVTIELLHFHYRIRNRWPAQPKRVLADLATWDEKASTLTRRASEGLFAQRYGAVQLLAAHVLAPIGGPMPLEWSVDWGPSFPSTKGSGRYG